MPGPISPARNARRRNADGIPQKKKSVKSDCNGKDMQTTNSDRPEPRKPNRPPSPQKPYAATILFLRSTRRQEIGTGWPETQTGAMPVCRRSHMQESTDVTAFFCAPYIRRMPTPAQPAAFPAARPGRSPHRARRPPRERSGRRTGCRNGVCRGNSIFPERSPP